MRTIEELSKYIPQKGDYAIDFDFMYDNSSEKVRKFIKGVIKKYPFIKGLDFELIHHSRYFNVKYVLYVSSEEEKRKLHSKDVLDEYKEFVGQHCTKKVVVVEE